MALILGGDGTITGNPDITLTESVSIAGTVTYEDVTSIDSVGIITARTGIHVTSGAVGIGTNNPSADLEIDNSNGAQIYLQRNNTTTPANRPLGQILFRGNDNSGVYQIAAKIIAMSAKAHADDDKPTNLEFHTTPDNSATAIERVRITSEGLVGIGTEDPSVQLHVENSTATKAYFSHPTSNRTTLYIESDDTSARIGSTYLSGGTEFKPLDFFTSGQRRVRVSAAGSFACGRNDQITMSTGNKTSHVFEQLANNQFPLGLHCDNTNKRGLAIFYADTGTGANGDPFLLCENQTSVKFQVKSNGSIVAAAGNFEIDGAGVMQTNLDSAGHIRLNSSGTFSGTNKVDLNSSNGNASFTGALSKGSGSFKIDHPLVGLTTSHHLVHSFIEGPQADLIYRGVVDLVDGTATVNIDTAGRMTEGTFAALCTNVSCFTSNESDWTAVKGSVTGNVLTITAQDNTSIATVSWMVVGERKDPHMINTDWTDDAGRVITEPLKS